MKRAKRQFFFLMILFAAAACNQRTELTPTNTISPNGGSSPSDVFPHTADFKTSTAHGAHFFSNQETCKSCHGVDLQGGTSGVSCKNCHSFPHTEEFKTTALHGTQFLEKEQSCKSCHGPDLMGGGAKVSCTTCHQYPHPKGWALPENHGQAFRKRKENPMKVDCLGCHASEATPPVGQPPKIIQCSQCHSSFPHSDEFKKTFMHGAAFLNNRKECSTCHTRKAADGTSTETCKKCHDYPHGPDWMLNQNHSGTFLRAKFGPEDPNNKNKLACEHCHGKDSELSKRHPKEFIECQSCHLIFPHSDDFMFEHASIAKEGPQACLSCHARIKELVPDYESCSTCHEGKLKVPPATWEAEDGSTAKVKPYHKKGFIPGTEEAKRNTASDSKKKPAKGK